jgi:hypothetical protein
MQDTIADAYRPTVNHGRSRFPETVRAQAPKGMGQAIAAAAQLKNTSNSEFIRRALLASLEASGVKLRRGMVIIS